MRDHQVCDASNATTDGLHALKKLPSRLESFKRNRFIQQEAQNNEHLIYIEEGWVAGASVLPTGCRQLVGLYLPGEIAGIDDLFQNKATETLTAIGEVHVRLYDVAVIRRALLEDQILSLAFLQISTLNTFKAKLQMTSIGRTPAAARLAGLIVGVATRLGCSPSAKTFTFDKFVTQETIADMTGLTPIHVNRTLRHLSESGLIERSGTSLTILDLPALHDASLLTDYRRAVTRRIESGEEPLG